MENIKLILAIASPAGIIILIFFAMWLGHKLTMRSISHFQPSTKEMVKMQQGTTSIIEDDWFEESQKEPPPKVSPEKENVIKKMFKKAGIPDTIWDSYKKNGKDPSEFLGFKDSDKDGSEISDVEDKIRKGDY